MSNEQKIEEQLLSQAVQATVTNQLDDVEEIDIDIQTDLFKLFQGQAQGISVSGPDFSR
jgi:O-phosphoseryl-tRNA(Cys) synthetase